MKKAIQYFKKPEKLTRAPTPQEIVDFIENYADMMNPDHKLPAQPISIRIEVPLLKAFKAKSKFKNVPYQTQIKELMREWIKTGKDTNY